MTDGLDINAQIRDRLEALRRTLNDPGLSDAMKAEEVACAHARIEFLESARPLADALNVVADLAAAPGGETCSTCKGKGTVVKDGPSEWEYDNRYPCPTCTMDRTALRGTGVTR